MKYLDRAVTGTAGLLFDGIQFFNKYKPAPAFTPKWSDKPLLKSWQNRNWAGRGKPIRFVRAV